MQYDLTQMKSYLNSLSKEITSIKTKMKKFKNDIENFEKATASIDGVSKPIWSGNVARIHHLRLRQNYNKHLIVINALIDLYNNLEADYIKKEKENQEASVKTTASSGSSSKRYGGSSGGGSSYSGGGSSGGGSSYSGGATATTSSASDINTSNTKKVTRDEQVRYEQIDEMNAARAAQKRYNDLKSRNIID